MAKNKISTVTRKKSVFKKQSKRSKLKLNIDHPVFFLVGLIIISLLIIILRSSFIDMPFERDEGDYSLAGRLILEGAKPYVDVLEQKPPGLFYSYAMIAMIFGSTVKGMQIGFIVVNIITTVLLGLAFRKLFSPTAALAGAVCFSILTLNPAASGFAVQAEHLLNLFVASSLYCLLLYFDKKKLYLLILAGALVAWSATIKQNGLFFIMGIILAIPAFHIKDEKFNLKTLFKEYIYLAIGGIGMAILVCGILLAQGVWDEFIFWSIRFPRERYLTGITFQEGMGYFNSRYAGISNFNYLLWYTSLAGLIFVYFSRLKLSVKIWISFFVLLSFFSIWPGLRFYGHYWLHFFLGIAMAFAALFFTIESIINKYFKNSLSLLLPLIATIIVSSVELYNRKGYYYKPVHNNIMLAVYGDNPFIETKEIAKFLKQRGILSTDKLLVAGSEPQLHFETEMDSPTPYTFMTWVASAHPEAKNWRNSYLETMKKNEARYAVMVVNSFSWLLANDESVQFHNEIYTYLESQYRRIGIADMISRGNTIYKWENEALSYMPQGQSYLIVYER